MKNSLVDGWSVTEEEIVDPMDDEGPVYGKAERAEIAAWLPEHLPELVNGFLERMERHARECLELEKRDQARVGPSKAQEELLRVSKAALELAAALEGLSPAAQNIGRWRLGDSLWNAFGGLSMACRQASKTLRSSRAKEAAELLAKSPPSKIPRGKLCLEEAAGRAMALAAHGALTYQSGGISAVRLAYWESLRGRGGQKHIANEAFLSRFRREWERVTGERVFGAQFKGALQAALSHAGLFGRDGDRDIDRFIERYRTRPEAPKAIDPGVGTVAAKRRNGRIQTAKRAARSPARMPSD